MHIDHTRVIFIKHSRRIVSLVVMAIGCDGNEHACASRIHTECLSHEVLRKC